jgi:erythromycin esterase-like protein
MEKGFTAVAVEADWPDAYRVNRFVQWGRHSRDSSAEDCLADFKRFPLWMWRNTVMVDFVNWLRDFNKDIPSHQRTAFYGMDLYSFYSSMEAVIQYLEKVSPEDAKIARNRYSHFERFQGDPQSYGFAHSLGVAPSYKTECVKTLVDLREKGEIYLKGEGGLIDGDELFYAEQNARLVQNAEEYYRELFQGDSHTWNIRDGHMAECVSSLLSFHEKKHSSPDQKIVLWAHNSHLGDSQYTDVSKYGQINLGHMLKERFKGHTFTVGFSTYTGTVTAAPKWDMPAHLYNVNPGMKDSYEEFFHNLGQQAEHENFMMILRKTANGRQEVVSKSLEEALSAPKLERYIGVIYRPDTERASHYSRSRIGKEYDAIIHFDSTAALQPLDISPMWLRGRDRAGKRAEPEEELSD